MLIEVNLVINRLIYSERQLVGAESIANTSK